jgi:hypothetical protein
MISRLVWLFMLLIKGFRSVPERWKMLKIMLDAFPDSPNALVIIALRLGFAS